ncbi:LacI family DNA-binding transcriptional regulator [Companilactobacillus halodurans]|nr:LacI family DNA-binding transcriptional regulator [Companilactobacillus halodurans]
MKRATIKDVSALSGFSISTVSRVLNGNYPVKKETRKKILKAVNELDFNRNSIARNLRTKKSNLIGLVVADIKNPYYSNIAKEIDNALFKYGYNLLVCNTDESEKKEEKILKALTEKRVDTIVISPASNNTNSLRKIQSSGTRIIIIDRNLGVNDFPFIGSNNFDESKALTQILIENGHKKIIFVAGTPNAMTSRERVSGFKASLIENNIKLSNAKIINGMYKENFVYKKMLNFLAYNSKNRNGFTAIFSSNNLMTAGIIKAANEVQVSIPENISLVSFGQLDFQEIIKPKITCIRQDIDTISEKIVENILLMNQPNFSAKNTIVKDFIEIGSSVQKIR